MAYSTVQGIFGSLETGRINVANWCCMDFFLEKVSKFKDHDYRTINIDFGAWTKFHDMDGIYFLGYDSHCYVICYLASKKIAYIADGGNKYLDGADTARDIRSFLNIGLVACEYYQQDRVDYCASSVVIIGLEHD